MRSRPAGQRLAALALAFSVSACETPVTLERPAARVTFAGCSLRWPALPDCPADRALKRPPEAMPSAPGPDSLARGALDTLQKYSEAGGEELALITASQTLIFSNDRGWLCYTYAIPGHWRPGPRPSLYLSEDRQASTEVLFTQDKYFEHIAGTDSLSRASTATHEKLGREFGRPLPPFDLVPFTSARAQGMRWKDSESARVDVGPGRSLPVGARVFVSVRPSWTTIVSVIGQPDGGHFAQRIVDSMDTTMDPDCYWSTIARTLGVVDGGSHPTQSSPAR